MIELLLTVLSGLVSIPVLVLFVQVVMAVNGPKNIIAKVSKQAEKIAVLIPAHNEELVIGETITIVKTQLSDDDRLVVVADNCSDNTASIARDLGAEVLERTDSDKLGKGFALDFGINHIRDTGGKPEVVIMIDADCAVEENCLDILIEKCVQTGRPAQALDLMRSMTDNPGQKFAEFAWIVKNWVRPLGFLNMGFPCQLMGTGMAFPFVLLNEVSLASANIVEDMKLGIDMARKGHSPVFCPEARVVSAFPDEVKGIKSQRTRWEHGHLGTILSEGPGLVLVAARKHDAKLLAMAMDLMVPPLAFLAIILFTTLALSAFASLFSFVSSLPFSIVMIASILFSLAVLMAWWGFARQVLSLKDLLGVPFYIIRKIPMYVRFWTRRQKDWVRTDRG